MKDSGYDSNTMLLPQRAAGYMSGPGGLANAPYVDMHLPYGAGALYSTTHDLLRWTTALFGGRLLSPAGLKKMITPERSNNAYGLVAGPLNGRTAIRHGGMLEGFSSHLRYYPESKITVVVLANVYGPPAAELAGQLSSLALSETVILPSDRQEVAVPAAILQRNVGVYHLAPQFTNTIRLNDDQLTTQMSASRTCRSFPNPTGNSFSRWPTARWSLSPTIRATLPTSSNSNVGAP